MKKGIYKLHIDCGRSGVVEGLFVTYTLYVEALLASKVVVYFGEILGKHSEIHKAIEPEEIKLITKEKKVVKMFEAYNLAIGHNPFNYETLQGESIEDYVNRIINNE